MKPLKEACIQVVIGLNVLLLFLWLAESRIVLPPFLMVAGRAHPLVLHFPIVMLVLAVIVVLIPDKLDIPGEVMSKIRTGILFAAAITAGLTALFGMFLSREEGYSGEVLLWHKWGGICTSLLAAYLLWTDQRGIRSSISKITSVLVLIILLVTGHWGAVLTHGDGFLTAPISKTTTQPDLRSAVVYQDLVVPVLREKCYSCHNGDKSKGDLNLTEAKAFSAGGKSGALIVKGASTESLLIKRLLLDINHKHRMPPKGKVQLTQPEIDLLTAWVNSGASLTAKLSETKGSDSLYQIARDIYGGDNQETYQFAAADNDVVAGFEGSEWVVAPVSFQSPGLVAECFNKAGFSSASIGKLSAVSKQVVSLNLSGMPVTDDDLKQISGFPHLRHLNLNYTNISDAGLEQLADMKELEGVMLTETKVTERGIQRLARNPNLRHIYAWNTAMTATHAAGITKKYPQVRIETGRQQDAAEELTLNPPVISPPNAYLREPFTLNITHPIHGTRLIYTMDGSSPDSGATKQFIKPISIDKNTIVRVKAAKDGWKDSKPVDRNFQRSAIRPERYVLLTKPHPLHKGNGAETLFDLNAGSTDILYASDGKWLGYQGENLTMEMMFGKPQTIKQLTLSTLISQALGAFPPSLVQVWGTEGNGTYTLLKEVKPVQPAEKTAVDHLMIACDLNGKSLTALKVVVLPLAKMPAWHAKKGQRGWLFVDEVLLN